MARNPIPLAPFGDADADWDHQIGLRFAERLVAPSWLRLSGRVINLRVDLMHTERLSEPEEVLVRRKLASLLMAYGASYIGALEESEAVSWLVEADEVLGDPHLISDPNDLVWSAAAQYNLSLCHMPYAPAYEGHYDPERSESHLRAATERIKLVDPDVSGLNAVAYVCALRAILEFWPDVSRQMRETWWREAPYRVAP